MRYLLLTFVLLSFSCQSAEPAPTLADTLTVVSYGADWCPYCKILEPKLEALSKKLNFKLIKVNADDRKAVQARGISIRYIPVISVYKNGRLYYHGPADDKMFKDRMFEMFGIQEDGPKGEMERSEYAK